MLTIAHDMETCAVADLKKMGTDAYAEHSHSRVLTIGYEIRGNYKLWIVGDPDPADLLDAISHGAMLTAWNANFEATAWLYMLRRQFPHWPQPKPEQFSCTMVRAQALAFPAGLDKCAEAMGLDMRKDRAGYNLMMKMCRPARKWLLAAKEAGMSPLDYCKIVPPDWSHHTPEALRQLGAYCRRDVEVEVAIGERVAQLEPEERELYLLDQRINRRGVKIDVPKVRKALALVEAETKVLNRELRLVTDRAVPAVSNPGKLRTWANAQMKTTHKGLRLNEPFVELPDLKKRTVAVALADNPLLRKDPETAAVVLPAVRRALEIRRTAGKASVKKLVAMLDCISTDGRARALFRFLAATTGRWSASRVQVHNMFRPILSKKEIEQVIELLDHAAGADAIRFGYAEPIDAVASCLRGMIVAEDGKRLIAGDLANIEGRMHAWLAGEEWKLQAFRDFDTIVGTDAKGNPIRKGADLYRLAYSRGFGIPVEQVTDDQRQGGKVMELSLQFLGGPFALLQMCLNLGQDPVKLARAVHAITDTEDWAYWHKRAPKDLRGLTADTWTGCRLTVQAWRNAHPAIKAYWYDLGDCAINAIEKRGKIFATKTRRVMFVSTEGFLYCRLPSGRCLSYCKPEVVWNNAIGEEITEAQARELLDAWADAGRRGPPPAKKQIMFWGVGKKSKRWERRKLSLPTLAENPTQAAARDVLRGGMFRAEAANYPIVLHVHDALVAEVPNGFGSAAEFNRIMCAVESYYAGLPVTAETHEAHRFQK